MNILKVHEIRRIGASRLEYSYTVEGDWQKYFDLSQPMWAEYNTSVEHVPDSVAVVPLIGNFIVLASLMDAEIYVNEIDKAFYESVPQFLRGFDEVMPDHVHFKLDSIIHAQRIVDNTSAEGPTGSNLLFFSGGVDATYSLVSHLEEKPALVTVWGADIPWDNEDSWNRAIGFNQEVADRYGLKLRTIRSNFRSAYCGDAIEDYSCGLVGDWWWPSFHHSIAMMALAAVLPEPRMRGKLYFGSTHSAKDRPEWGSYFIASDPKIDNFVRFGSCQVIHDGYEASRYDKIKKICGYYESKEQKPYLRVCYLSNTGKNCGVCEKCASAIMSILLAGGNPRDYGFDYDPAELPRYFAAGFQEMAHVEKFDCLSLYHDVWLAYRERYRPEEVPPVLRAFYETELATLADFLLVPNNQLLEYRRNAQKAQQELYDQIGRLNYELSAAHREAADAKAALDAAQQSTMEYISTLTRELEQEKALRQQELESLKNSTSWKLTRPIRWLGRKLTR